ncbi:ribonucleoside-diphosphate reductase alpha chain [Chromatocurvus halotolerans]|uniref:Ribonucleoside-diphosphate reductase n=2 Tax=Chromatocurvus halotolerans TaxID=1132028 RepID=A0A4R2KUY9_9GAMM|nr:LAGLIDADG family homing endonuclease [Chromatocurvus halotolerans]TCO76732.1 ribonucleoside-diphosphate reductase alpha chain [Chromatocurvus halotolerans]
MGEAVQALTAGLDIDLQPASLDIWDKKYRLKDRAGSPVDREIIDTYKRVARALADAEDSDDKRKQWYQRFVWALQNGALPAGRIISNAGAQAYKPATSTINCTVSGSIVDSMDDILNKNHEAGMTLKAGCGIGYEFSTLRPRGAYVSGAGAYTSGPLSFMDIYDKMCFTVSSAGGRRGAQMATFDINHPDVLDFIRAKRENGRLRQFNLSLLITTEFIEAVKAGTDWPLSFPMTEKEATESGFDLNDPTQVVWRPFPVKKDYLCNDTGDVACRVYKTVPAQRLWDMIMASTYDFAEPGFILIDKVNEMNNNWWQESIRATNPCVTADIWVQTAEGPQQVADLVGQPFQARVDGEDHASGAEGFFRTATKDVVRLQTREGHALRLTSDHRVRRVSTLTRWRLETEWCEAGQLRAGDQVLLNNHRDAATWAGRYGFDEGYLTGLLIGDGTLQEDKAVLSVRTQAAAVNDSGTSDGTDGIMAAALAAAQRLPQHSDLAGWQKVGGSHDYSLATGALRELAAELGMAPERQHITQKAERSSSDFHRGLLRGLFDARGFVGGDGFVGSEGFVQGNRKQGVSIRLSQSSLTTLKAAQRMLLRLGINSTLHREERQPEGEAQLSGGHDGSANPAAAETHELVISGDNIATYAESVGFADTAKQDLLEQALAGYPRQLSRERFVATVAGVQADGVEDVFDVQVPGINTFDANGLHAHNCGEQPLPPYGSCLLGSINLTKLVLDPFTDKARFDWDRYREVVAVFTRMLDNVVEINGLPLPEQRHEITYKRRHGMGFLGLGSTLTMLGMRYGDDESVEFTEEVSREMAITGWQQALELSREKGAAPIMDDTFEVTPAMLELRPEMVADGIKAGDKLPGKVLHARYSRYMQRVAEVAPELVEELAAEGARFTHHSSIAPTGTISLSLANNASNGIEPSFAHHYSRNVIREGRKSKEKVDVFSFELLAYRERINPRAMPYTEDAAEQLPDYFSVADDVTPKQHVDIQAAAQKWVDSSISKTANVPTDYPFEDFKNIYLYAHEKGLKGCTTFRFNPEAFQGVLVKESDLENTRYQFTLEDGSTVEVNGNEEVEYDGEMHSAANLFDALKEGYYGKF